jgi:hypothetical protein
MFPDLGLRVTPKANVSLLQPADKFGSGATASHVARSVVSWDVCMKGSEWG